MSKSPIESISAVTLFVSDMEISVKFYMDIGFNLAFGGSKEKFSCFVAGKSYLNLTTMEGERGGSSSGRVIFHVRDVDEIHSKILDCGYEPDFDPSDANWGERYFHLRDPDGHELSFARPLDAG